MITVLAKISINDLAQFISVFATRGARMRKKYGSQRSQIFQLPREAGRIVILFDWESKSSFEAFRQDPLVRETMAAGTTMGSPEFTFPEKVADLPN